MFDFLAICQPKELHWTFNVLTPVWMLQAPLLKRTGFSSMFLSNNWILPAVFNSSWKLCICLWKFGNVRSFTQIIYTNQFFIAFFFLSAKVLSWFHTFSSWSLLACRSSTWSWLWDSTTGREQQECGRSAPYSKVGRDTSSEVNLLSFTIHRLKQNKKKKTGHGNRSTWMWLIRVDTLVKCFCRRIHLDVFFHNFGD